MLCRRIFAILLACSATAALAPAVSAGPIYDEPYNMPSSFVVRGVFGFGILLCADDATPSLVDDLVQNGPCFDYGGHEGGWALGSANDGLWADTSLTLAIDLNGDGCVSDSCQGTPNDADVREANCGTVMIPLPPTTNGAAPTIQAFLRVVDVDPSDLTVCGASAGEVQLHIL